jgi:predicted nucleic acid-binding protein
MFLVDTDILSESTKAAPNAGVLSWIETNEPAIRISSISLGEIQYGIELLDAGRKQAELRKWLQSLRDTYADSIIPIDDLVGLRWGELKADLEKRGRKMPVVDSLLAATAMEHHLTLVTSNTRDFLHSGVRLLNPV